jgi:beta-lactamase superfamily II metal-dependent hydrolase
LRKDLPVLEFYFWDVQHGHATYIKTPNNRHVVVDLGIGSFSTKHEFSPLLHLRNKYGVKQLDFVVITHPHRDHIDDIFNFHLMMPKVLHRPKHLSAQDIKGGNRGPSDYEKVDEYLKISDSYNVEIPAGSFDNSTIPDSWGGVKMQFFTPFKSNTANLNNHSVVSIFEYLGFKVIVPGDNEKLSWTELLTDPAFRDASQNAHVLLAPHHGREAGFCMDLLDHARPHVVVISDGPEGDTSVTDKYGAKVRQYHPSGWRSYYRDDTWDDRFCVTTRCDGMIRVRIYKANDNTNRLNVILYDGSGAHRD